MKNVQLDKIELVKPNSINSRMSNEVEALCESFGCGYNVAKANGDTETDSDILF